MTKTLKDIESIKDELGECVFGILKEPTAIDVDYYFFQIDGIVSELRNFVSECNHNNHKLY